MGARVFGSTPTGVAEAQQKLKEKAQEAEAHERERSTALRGASAGLRPSACATSASSRRSPFRTIRPIELAPRTKTARKKGS